MRLRTWILAAVCAACGGAGPASGGVEQHIVTATGQLAVLNGLGTLNLQAFAPRLPLGIPAPAGVATMVLQSTFEPPGPHLLTIQLFCSEVVAGPYGKEYFGSGPSGEDTYYVRLVPVLPVGLYQFGFSTTPVPGPCGAGVPANIPIIGPAAIVSASAGY